MTNSTQPVLCLGEALIDVISRKDAEVEEHVGGSPLTWRAESRSSATPL